MLLSAHSPSSTVVENELLFLGDRFFPGGVYTRTETYKDDITRADLANDEQGSSPPVHCEHDPLLPATELNVVEVSVLKALSHLEGEEGWMSAQDADGLVGELPYTLSDFRKEGPLYLIAEATAIVSDDESAAVLDEDPQVLPPVHLPLALLTLGYFDGDRENQKVVSDQILEGEVVCQLNFAFPSVPFECGFDFLCSKSSGEYCHIRRARAVEHTTRQNRKPQ